MGFFTNPAKQEEAEHAILQSMSKLDILELLVRNILGEAEENNPWITSCQEYYDGCVRVVTIAADLCEVKWSDVSYEKDASGKERRNEEIKGRIAYSYTKSGYIPLHSHFNEKGKEDVSVNRVIYLWASIVRERLQSKMPECKFEDVTEGDGYAFFRYRVPGLTWKSWF